MITARSSKFKKTSPDAVSSAKYSNGQTKVIALIGAPGSGKTTQADLLAKNLQNNYRGQVAHLNVGQLLRDSKDPKLKKIMDQGRLVPDEVVYSLIKDFFHKTKPELIVIDGFFRRPSEAEWLIDHQAKLNLQIKVLIDLKLSKKSAMERLLGRGREDDQLEDIRVRLSIFKKERRAVLKTVRGAKIPIIKVSAEPKIETIEQNIFKKIQSYLSKT